MGEAQVSELQRSSFRADLFRVSDQRIYVHIERDDGQTREYEFSTRTLLMLKAARPDLAGVVNFLLRDNA
jgi:hypothetical protein